MNSLDLRMVLWGVSPADYDCPSPEIISDRVLSKIAPGTIVVMHDNKNCLNTPKAVQLILKGLKEKGLRCVTVSDLIKGGQVECR